MSVRFYYFKARIDFHNQNADSLSWLDVVPVNGDEGEYLVSQVSISSS